MSGLFTKAEWERIQTEALQQLAALWRDNQRGAPFIAQDAYDINQDAFRTCLSCGSKTQPCCGH